jgi:CHAD domain-containing protein
MAENFSIYKNKPVGDELERIITMYIENFKNHLQLINESRHTNIHEIRRLLKKMRAFLRFIKPSFTSDEFKMLNMYLGKINKTLSGIRESRVNLQIFEKIMPKMEGNIMNGTLQLIHQHLSFQCQQNEENEHKLEEIIEDVRLNMDEFSNVIHTTKIKNSDIKEIIDGMVAVYRTGKKLLKQSVKTDDTEIVHNWRKYVKHLQFELQFIQHYLPDYYIEHINVLQQISNLLGEEHDLAVMLDYMNNSLKIDLTEQELHQINLITDKRRNKVKKKAFRLGHTIFDTDSRYFRKEIESFLLN